MKNLDKANVLLILRKVFLSEGKLLIQECWVKEVRTLAVGLNYILKGLFLDCQGCNFLKFQV